MEAEFFTSKKSRIVISMIVIMTFLISALLPYNYSYAANTQYNTLEKRTKINQTKYNESEKMSAAQISKYNDASLADMFETNEKGMTKSQQQTVKVKADEIVAIAQSKSGEQLSDYEKIRAFHDWIIENFYYYKDVNKISSSCDNPYYLLTTEYKKSNQRIRSRCNGYSATLIAFARSHGIAARGISGDYIPDTRKTPNNAKWNNVKPTTKTHTWTQVYLDKNGDGKNEWIVIDCNADCWNRYDGKKYYEEGNFYDRDVYEAVRCAYFDVSAKRLAQSHVITDFRPGSKAVKYIDDKYEVQQIKKFLNIKANGATNGKKINASYNADKPETWIAKNDVKTLGDGYGKLYKLYWPSNKKLSGKLDFSKFTSLQNFSVTNNNITSLYLKNCTSLTTVAASQNKLTTIDTRGSKNLTLLSVQGNPATSVSYTFNKSKTGIIKTNNKGGTVSVKYSKSGSKHQHTMAAFAKAGYKFQGWYQGSKCISKNSKLVKTNANTFTYVAKFKKK